MHSLVKKSISHQQQGWPPAPSLPGEDSVAPSQSASSAVVSPGSRDSGEDSPSDSLGQSSSSLKEHDYISLAEVSSAPPPIEPQSEVELNLAETDLRLGLGPSSETLSDKAPECKDRGLLASSHASDAVTHIRDDSKLPPSISSIWQSAPSKSLADAMSISHVSVYQSPSQLATSKNGGKRLYGEAMVDASRDPRSTMNGSSTAVLFNASETRSCIHPMKQFPDPGLFWAAPHLGTCWQPQNDPRSSSYRPIASQKGMFFSSAPVEVDGEALHTSKLDHSFRSSDGAKLQQFESEEKAHDEAPPAKGQVVGWPPVRSYRRSTLATRLKPAGEEADSQSTIYVKVNMDGIPIGRKVDLSAYKSYDGLLSALEEMFHNPNGGYGAKFLKGSEFVLTYEDKEGDWMLVGDVPWGMFINTVRRLRITRGPDMAGLGSRTSTCQV